MAPQPETTEAPTPKPELEPAPEPMPESQPEPKPEPTPMLKAPNSIDIMVPSGTKVLPVRNNAGFSIGQKIVIDAGTPIEEHNTIVGFGSLILADPLKYDHAAGAVVSAAGAIVSPSPSGAVSGGNATLDEAGFKATTTLSCPPEMEVFFNRLLKDKGYKECSHPHVQGLMHWFTGVPDMDFQYVIDVIDNGNPCKFWAKEEEECPELSPECAGNTWCR